jgi:pimeloyl-ACP methyl ester carboxylesterase
MEHKLVRVTYNLSTIAFQKYGSGKEFLLAFHGFSENGKSFEAICPALEPRFTVYAMDMPYHGESIWKEAHHFNRKDLHNIVQILQDQEGFEYFSVLGFSMGGKSAMSCVLHFREKVKGMYLLASDGIKTRAVYNLAVYPAWGRFLFKGIVKRPGWFFTLLRLLHKVGILSPWLLKFTVNHMDTLEKRQRLYDTWVSMSDFHIPISRLKAELNALAIPVWLVFGKRDEVIPPSVAHGFAEGLEHVHVELIDRGHYFIDERVVPILSKII